MKCNETVPGRLYKYRAFSNRTLAMVVRDRLHFADPGTFNDPLDARAYVEIDVAEGVLETVLRALVKERVTAEMRAAAKTMRVAGDRGDAHIKRASGRAADGLIEHIEYHATNPDYDDEAAGKRVLFRHHINSELLRRYDRGIVSLAERADCPVMWSHYGDQHRICVGYSVPGDAVGMVRKVRYGGSRRIEISKVAAMMDGDDAARADFYRPPEDSEETRYLRARRAALGGFLPARNVRCERLAPPPLSMFRDMLEGSGKREVSTTMAVVRMLQRLLRDKRIGRYVVPIVPDEARTFGMDSLFSRAGIFTPGGQRYQPVDAGTIAPYHEAEDGQILQEGICETGAMASFLAAGTAYANYALPMIPFYIFYSMFGFQRVGDMIWSCGDMLCKGFLLGGTSGRTTLNGEGVQHQDGHSHVAASTVPNLKSYDPSFAFEIAVIVRDGIRRMYQEFEDVFYYITVTNQNYHMPPMPKGVEDGIVKGMYCFRRAGEKAQVNLLGSGAIMVEVMAAAETLERLGITTNIWSVTSYNELARQGAHAERAQLLSVGGCDERPYVEDLLADETGVFVAASDYMKALPLSISRWFPSAYVALGTDGFGLSESRGALRDHFEVSSDWIAFAALSILARTNQTQANAAFDFAQEKRLDLEKAPAD